jgi:hypothetical protein
LLAVGWKIVFLRAQGATLEKANLEKHEGRKAYFQVKTARFYYSD